MSVTYHPSKKKRKNKHGFLRRMRKPSGRRVLASRRRKKRARLAI